MIFRRNQESEKVWWNQIFKGVVVRRKKRRWGGVCIGGGIVCDFGSRFS